MTTQQTGRTDPFRSAAPMGTGGARRATERPKAPCADHAAHRWVLAHDCRLFRRMSALKQAKKTCDAAEPYGPWWAFLLRPWNSVGAGERG